MSESWEVECVRVVSESDLQTQQTYTVDHPSEVNSKFLISICYFYQRNHIMTQLLVRFLKLQINRR